MARSSGGASEAKRRISRSESNLSMKTFAFSICLRTERLIFASSPSTWKNSAEEVLRNGRGLGYRQRESALVLPHRSPTSLVTTRSSYIAALDSEMIELVRRPSSRTTSGGILDSGRGSGKE